jgi:DNA-cytosine methyltransferase
MKKTFATIFSGIGGADLGLTNAGYSPSWAIEWNQGAIDILKANHDIPIMIHDDVCAVDYYELPEVDILWASPVCCEFSGAKHGGGETELDIRSAEAVVRAASRARSVIIENVPKYQDSKSYRLIYDSLSQQGFCTRYSEILNAAHYGNPSSRSRFYAIFSRDQVESRSSFQSGRFTTAWFDELHKYCDYWVGSELTRNQLLAIHEGNDFRMTYPHKPFAIERCGYYGTPKLILPSSNFPAIKSHSGHDGKKPKPGYGKIGSYRRQYDFVHEGRAYTLTPQLMGILMGFPIDYDWSNNKAQAVAGIGNSVVPKMAEMLASLV